MEFIATYNPYLWCLSAFFFGMAAQNAINRKTNSILLSCDNEDLANHNELLVKYLYVSGEFYGLRFVINSDSCFRFDSPGKDVNDSLKNAAIRLSDISNKINEAHEIETKSDLS
ncbi:MAG: hypothetical protein E6Q59_08845 [Nitrosomonas sp.]|nr:MAG: hypothetical protein E6Q59_08845 [Nitrosomonas sp.]